MSRLTHEQNVAFIHIFNNIWIATRQDLEPLYKDLNMELTPTKIASVITRDTVFSEYGKPTQEQFDLYKSLPQDEKEFLVKQMLSSLKGVAQ